MDSTSGEQRLVAEYADARPFVVKSADYTPQFSKLYMRRLEQLKPRVLELASSTWPGVHIMAKIIDVKPGQECIVVGTVFKVMEKKPNVLDEYTEKMIMAGGREHKANYVGESDSIVLEDSYGRMVINCTLDESLKSEGVFGIGV